MVKDLQNSPGLIPLKLGSAKIQEYTHSLIHYYDLNPLISEINKLKTHSENLRQSVKLNSDYSNDTSNYLKVLELTEDKVENKLIELLPNPKRLKRGLINGLGSIFKVISGNLDATDGEKYDKLIEELQNNQNNLAQSLRKQNSLSLSLINKFNSTIRQMIHNEKLLESKINQISQIVTKAVYRENSMYIKDTINQIINLFEVINSVLQDIENSIAFAKLGVMHPSIMTTAHLYNELIALQKYLKEEQLPIEINHENILLYEKIIKVKGYIKHNKITYILQIPITYPFIFDYLHLFSVPIKKQGQFKAIIPKNKYLTKNILYYAFSRETCEHISSHHYLCDEMDLQEISETDPCEIQLLAMKNTSTCRQVSVQITKPIFKRLDLSNQWIGVFPTEQKVRLQCQEQEEVHKLLGTFIFEVPEGCQIFTNQEIFRNKKTISTGQPLLLPEIDIGRIPSVSTNITVRLDNIELDELQEVRNEIINNQVPRLHGIISTTPSVWTLGVCGVLVCTLIYCAYDRVKSRCSRTSRRTNESINLSEVQIPR